MMTPVVMRTCFCILAMALDMGRMYNCATNNLVQTMSRVKPSKYLGKLIHRAFSAAQKKVGQQSVESSHAVVGRRLRIGTRPMLC
jgi:hypothetical protein